MPVFYGIDKGVPNVYNPMQVCFCGQIVSKFFPENCLIFLEFFLIRIYSSRQHIKYTLVQNKIISQILPRDALYRNCTTVSVPSNKRVSRALDKVVIKLQNNLTEFFLEYSRNIFKSYGHHFANHLATGQNISNSCARTQMSDTGPLSPLVSFHKNM